MKRIKADSSESLYPSRLVVLQQDLDWGSYYKQLPAWWMWQCGNESKHLEAKLLLSAAVFACLFKELAEEQLQIHSDHVNNVFNIFMA